MRGRVTPALGGVSRNHPETIAVVGVLVEDWGPSGVVPGVEHEEVEHEGVEHEGVEGVVREVEPEEGHRC